MVSIILNSWNPTRAHLHCTMACLAAIRKFTDPEYEIIVVDNTPELKIRDDYHVLEPYVLIQNTENHTVYESYNQGAGVAKYDKLVFIQSDVFCHERTINKLVKYLDEYDAAFPQQVPTVTFVATMNVVIMNNLKPVLVDVDKSTVNIDPDLIEKAITKRTVAIMPVHLLGQPANMDAIMKIAKKHKLRIVEDSCETMFVNKVQGDAACFSTYLAHLLVTGIGGFITTNDKKLATVMRSMMFHGRDESYLNIDDKPADISKRFWFPRFGYSDRMTELEAALGLGELDGWEEMIERRQNNARYLYNELSLTMAKHGASEVWGPVVDVDNHAFMFFPILVKNRDKLMLYLEKQGIQTRTMMPLTTQPVVQPYVKKKYPNADFINEHGLLIGCHQYLSKKELNFIVNSIKEFYA